MAETYFREKPCRRCGGHYRYKKGCHCVTCQSLSNKAYREEQGTEAWAEWMREYRRRGNPAYMHARAAKRARVKGFEFSITKDDIKVPDVCPCCERSFDLDRKTRGSASLDRIDTNKGYVPGNIAVICWRCNAMKQDAQSPEELENIVKWWRGLLKAEDPPPAEEGV